MSRRHLVLQEMGLTPVWRLRRADDFGAAEPDVDDVPADKQEVSQAESLTADTGMGSPAPTPGAQVVQPGETLAAPVPQTDEAGRRRAILQMDWAALEDAVARCVACPLHAKRTNTVFGVGDGHAQWLFVGEGPGAEEDAKGEPFVGQAGRLLDNMLAAIDLKRGENVYIANVVKCRPPNNRNPESGEMRCCEPYLTRQIELIRPNLIVALGKIAASHLLRTDASIASLRGRVHDYDGTPLIVTYHPAYLLRTLPDKAKSWADLCFARDTMRGLASDGREAVQKRS